MKKVIKNAPFAYCGLCPQHLQLNKHIFKRTNRLRLAWGILHTNSVFPY